MPLQFVEHLKEHLAAAGALDASLRGKGWKGFMHMGFPSRKGEFQYLPLHLLYPQRYLLEKQPEQMSVSAPPSVIHMPLSKALRSSYSSYLTQRIEKQLKEEKNPLAMLSLAMCLEGLFIYIPPKVCIEEPIEIVCPSLPMQLTSPRIYVYVGKGAQGALHIKYKEASWTNSFIDIVLEEGASLSTLSSSEEEESFWHTSSMQCSLKRAAQLSSFSLIKGGAVNRQEMIVSLTEEDASASLKGLWTLGGQSQAHTHIVMRHLAPRCSSMQHFKGVLRGESLSSFEGKIHVEPIAQKTEAYQLNNNLLLSPQAQANSKPNLEIFADDVKASHGATTTSLSKEDLFYLKTRGLSSSLAKELLVEGFCQEILKEIPASFKRVAHG